MERQFFCFLDNGVQNTLGSWNVSSKPTAHHWSEHESSGTKLLQEISKNSTQCESIHFIGEDGVIVVIPLFICGLIWPSLVDVVREIYCPCEEVTYYAVSVPCDSRILNSIKDLVFTGRYSCPDYDMLKRVYEFTQNSYLALDITIHEMYQRDVSLSLDTLEAHEHLKNIKYESHIESDLSFAKNIRYSQDTNIGYSQDTDDGDINSISYGISGNCEEKHEKEMLPNQEVFEVVSSKIKQQGNRCSKFCRNDCGRVFESWSAADAQQIKDQFRGRSYVEIKQKMNSHLKAQVIINDSNDEGYIFKGHMLCTKFLEFTTGVSEYLFKKVLRDFRNGIRNYNHGNSGVIKCPTTATIGFCCWFKTFLILHGQDAPDKEVVVVNYWRKGKTLYQTYLEEAPNPHVQLSTFYKHIKKFFGPKRQDKTLQCVRNSDYSSHAVCDICTSLNYAQKMCKNEAELEMIKSHRNLHKIDYSMARRVVENLRQYAIEFPEDVLYLQIDGMDNQKVSFTL